MIHSSLMETPQPLTFLCLASFEKGHRFLTEAKRLGCRVYLLTSLSLRDRAEFPRQDLQDIFYMPDVDSDWDLKQTANAVSHLCRTVQIDRIVPLDDFDLEKASFLREHLRIKGLGETATRFFRDKLAMRMKAAENGISVPEFTATINYEQIARFVDTVPAPWVLKPRHMAGAIGIRKFDDRQQLWNHLNSLGDTQPDFVLECFVPGDIFHVDSIWFRGKMVFSVASAYGTPPLEVAQGGGIFTTHLLDRGSSINQELQAFNERVLNAFGLRDGVSHTEFLRSHADGSLYFLETSARVGGAQISDLIEAATGVNLWAEWAKIEVALGSDKPYSPPEPRVDYAGLIVSLTRQEWPDTSNFTEPELVWRLRKKHHLGLIVRSTNHQRVGELLHTYSERVRNDYHASAPPRERPRD